MEWIQPAFFWGLLGISVPIAIHLWNGRRGKVIAWAATDWLSAKESQSNRSLKLEHWLLLLFRLLLLFFLVLVLVGLWWKSLEQASSPEVVHLIVPNPAVEAEFRFELERAQARGEKVYWMAEGLPAYEVGENPSLDFDAGKSQEYLDLLPLTLDSLHLYSSGMASDFRPDLLWVPKNPELHLAAELPESRVSTNVVGLENGDFLGLDAKGMLAKIPSDLGLQEEKTVFSAPIPVHIELTEETGKKEIEAALDALKEVYGLSFSEAGLEDAKVVFATQQIGETEAGKLCFLTSASTRPESDLQIQLEDPVSLPWDESVEKGVLPELILAPLIEFLGIKQRDLPATKSQIAQKFVEIPRSKQALSANATEIMLILVVVIFGIERFLAYRNNL
jgi:hypothetical protein